MAKSIMIQGTMSNVGKSLIAGGLCRIFKQDGYRVAPFKSQNMALNSYITLDGLEMGRAQVMQAEAAGIEPDVRMNPILLKPTNDTGSQVIVNGKVLGTMSAREYYKNKLSLVPEIMSAYNSLAKENDIIVIEGAGSPAEINLKDNDIVNMGMARLAKAPVLLVGDIDRGGVFAQLLGTVDLLDEAERAYVKGIIINKFRGDRAILKPGLDMLEERSHKHVLGVVPYVHCDIDDEDSLTERFTRHENTGLIDIAVIKLPRISNFTDFNALERIEGVSLRYVWQAGDIGEPDMIIVPGTKSTVDDLLWLRENGIEAKIKQLAARDRVIFGICGGYQMLGESITDNVGAERKGIFKGMELLPVKTVFEQEKTRTRVKGVFKNIGGDLRALQGQAFEGYEIHMGTSIISSDALKPMNVLHSQISKDEGKAEGINHKNIYGSYVHGIFDNENTAKTIISALMEKKGIDSSSVKAFNMAAYKESQYNILAEAIRQSVDMEAIYNILNLGI